MSRDKSLCSEANFILVQRLKPVFKGELSKCSGVNDRKNTISSIPHERTLPRRARWFCSHNIVLIKLNHKFWPLAFVLIILNICQIIVLKHLIPINPFLFENFSHFLLLSFTDDQNFSIIADAFTKSNETQLVIYWYHIKKFETIFTSCVRSIQRRIQTCHRRYHSLFFGSP